MNNKIILALLLGVAAGTAVGLLYAPDSGENTRKRIAELRELMMRRSQNGSDEKRESGNRGGERTGNQHRGEGRTGRQQPSHTPNPQQV
jgi:gas vesicle protein